MGDTQLWSDGRRPRVGVLGYGVLGSGAIEAAANLGCAVTAVGRSRDVGQIREQGLFAQSAVSYRSLEIGPSSSREEVVRLLNAHDYVIDAREPYPQSLSEVEAGERGTRWLYRCAREAGFTVADNIRRTKDGEFRKRLIRLGSPPAEIPRRFQGRLGFHEDVFSLPELVATARTDPSWQNHYFQGKVRMAVVAADEAREDLDLLTVAPMYAIAWWADHGPLEPVAELARPAMASRIARHAPVVVPSTPTNCLPTDVAGRAYLLAAMVGTTGDVYQVAGAKSSTFDVIAQCLAHAGIRAIRVPLLQPVMQLMRGSELLSILWSAGAVRSWHVALTYEAGTRSSAKIRDLNRLLPHSLGSLAVPSDDDIERMLPQAIAQKARWLQLNGKLPA